MKSVKRIVSDAAVSKIVIDFEAAICGGPGGQFHASTRSSRSWAAAFIGASVCSVPVIYKNN